VTVLPADGVAIGESGVGGLAGLRLTVARPATRRIASGRRQPVRNRGCHRSGHLQSCFVLTAELTTHQEVVVQLVLFRRKRLHIGALICHTLFQKRSMRMRAGWPIVATILSVAVAYVAYPYVTLYRLGSAIQRADAATLESLVDWPAVREGIKEDVCDLASDDPTPKTGGALPPFGASFRRGIASSAIDQAVTPQALLAATSAPTLPANNPAPRGADVHVGWAFFDGLTTFTISLHAPGQIEPLKLEMDLHNGEWRVQRVWLPAELLRSGSQT
jgi:hypothetical protein